MNPAKSSLPHFTPPERMIEHQLKSSDLPTPFTFLLPLVLMPLLQFVLRHFPSKQLVGDPSYYSLLLPPMLKKPLFLQGGDGNPPQITPIQKSSLGNFCSSTWTYTCPVVGSILADRNHLNNELVLSIQAEQCLPSNCNSLFSLFLVTS